MADAKGNPKLRGFQTRLRDPEFLPEKKQSRHSSTLAKDRLKKMMLHQPEAADTPVAPAQSGYAHFLLGWMRRFAGLKKMILLWFGALRMSAASVQRPRRHSLSEWMKYIASLMKIFQQRIGALHWRAVPARLLRWHFLAGWMRRLASLQKMVQQQIGALPLPAFIRLSHPYLRSDRKRRIASFLIVLIIGGVFAFYLQLVPTRSGPSTQKSQVSLVSQVTKTYIRHQQKPTSPQRKVPTPTPSKVPTPTPTQQKVPTPTPTPPPQQQTPPPVISAAISAGNPLYSTARPFSACDKQGGHWTNTSGASMTCNSSGGEMVNTSGQLAMVNLDQLGGNQSPWPGQNFIVQMQATINSQGAFGIDFQPDAGGYFAYLVVPPNNYWAFNYYTPEGTLASTLISGPLPSSMSTQLTVDVRVEGTAYSFYINGVDTTGLAVTGSQYINKIAGLAVDARADITFSNFAIYALP